MTASYEKVEHLFKKMEAFFARQAREEADYIFILMALYCTVELIEPEQKETLRIFQEKFAELKANHIDEMIDGDMQMLINRITKKLEQINALCSSETEVDPTGKNELLNSQINLVVSRLKY
ncbi:MAG TPA: hypothetical protein PKI61_04245 [bacterium]|nr:hypothetical protein [bacterium]HPT29613.1 hypothetical protein [bacterium]